jgi:hypothetical protein
MNKVILFKSHLIFNKEEALNYIAITAKIIFFAPL